MPRDGKYGEISIPGIPDDEPIFILRAKDHLSPDTLDEYFELACDAGCNSEFTEGVDAVRTKFIAWRDENQSKLKLPD